MLLRHLRAADGSGPGSRRGSISAQALSPRRIGEGGAAGAAASAGSLALALISACGRAIAVARRDGRAGARGADPVCRRHVAVTIGEGEVSRRQGVRGCRSGRCGRGDRASRSARGRRRRHSSRSAPPMVPGCRTGIRGRRCARVARGSATLRSSAAAPAIDRRRPSTRDLGEGAATRRITTSGHPAVADQQVGADADHRDRHVGRQRRQERGEVGGIGRPQQDLRRAADAEPGDADRAAHRPTSGRERLGQPVDQVRAWACGRAIMPPPVIIVGDARGPAAGCKR